MEKLHIRGAVGALALALGMTANPVHAACVEEIARIEASVPAIVNLARRTEIQLALADAKREAAARREAACLVQARVARARLRDALATAGQGG